MKFLRTLTSRNFVGLSILTLHIKQTKDANYRAFDMYIQDNSEKIKCRFFYFFYHPKSEKKIKSVGLPERKNRNLHTTKMGEDSTRAIEHRYHRNYNPTKRKQKRNVWAKGSKDV